MRNNYWLPLISIPCLFKCALETRNSNINKMKTDSFNTIFDCSVMVARAQIPNNGEPIYNVPLTRLTIVLRKPFSWKNEIVNFVLYPVHFANTLLLRRPTHNDLLPVQ